MSTLGELEQRVMDVLWSAEEPKSVRAVLDVLLAEKQLAYTTVMTVLDRLAKKGIVDRERHGRQWIYRPARDRSALIADQVQELLGADEHARREVLVELARRLPELSVVPLAHSASTPPAR